MPERIAKKNGIYFSQEDGYIIFPVGYKPTQIKVDPRKKKPKPS